MEFNVDLYLDTGNNPIMKKSTENYTTPVMSNLMGIIYAKMIFCINFRVDLRYGRLWHSDWMFECFDQSVYLKLA